MTDDEAKTVTAVTGALMEGPYKMVSLSFRPGFYITGPSGMFRDSTGARIDFHEVDAEKIVRLYNQDYFEHVNRKG